MLEAKNLIKIYGNRKVVDNLSLTLKKGEIIGLLGPNGAGKTTTFYMIVGIVRPTSGNIYIDNRDITKFPMYKRARMGIGYLPQEPSIFRKLTVEENIIAVLELIGVNKKERRDIAYKYLEELGIAHLAKSKAYTLSGGERRRLEITRTLVTNPSFILLDEPFAGVDPIAVEDIQEVIFKLKEKGIGILITDHNVYETLRITDYSYIIYQGKILKKGKPKELAEDEEVKKIYLGEKFKLIV